jgi:hypothetical protein
MKTDDDYDVSILQERWLDEASCLVGFTITYANEAIENHMRQSTIEDYPQVLHEQKLSENSISKKNN